MKGASVAVYMMPIKLSANNTMTITPIITTISGLNRSWGIGTIEPCCFELSICTLFLNGIIRIDVA